MKQKKITALISAAVLAFTMFTGCDDSWLDDEDEETASSSHSSGKYEGQSLSDTELSDIDITSISRSRRESCVPMGPNGTWSIFVYLCGTDLESDGGMASGDIDEMLAVSGNSDIKFIVQTGGTKKWQKNISSNKIERYVICNGKMERVDSVANANMGSSEVLTDFIRWGTASYPAARNGLVLWNHGGGSISGVCFDEKTDDSLSLREIDAALFSSRDVMTDDFEFIGFDACLMGTVETASILASHARYMVASEELEPGAGWAYTEIGNYLVKNPGADGRELGKVICDSYYEACRNDDSEGESTLSVTDLSKIDNVIIKFRQFSKDLYEGTDNNDKLAEFVRNVRKKENFGGNSFWEGYSNMVDMKGIIDSGASYSSYAAQAAAAINEAVVYKRNGEYHSDSCGLSMYYPLCAGDGSAEIKIFKDICISTHYLAIVDKILYGASNGSLDTYHDAAGILGSIIDWTSDFFGLDDAEDGDYYTYDPDDEYDDDDDFWSILFDDWDDYDDEGEFDVDFDEEPYLDEDGTYGFILSEDSLENTSSISSYVYMLTDDYEEMIDLGITSDIFADWDTGEVTDNFDGSWFCLDDGQPLAVYLIEEGDGYDIFTSPVMVNDEETNIRFCWNYEEDEIYILGLWDGMEESGCANRNGNTLSPGDVIVPVYYSYSVDDDSESEYIGDEYVYDGNDALYFDYLPDGDYLYGFCIDDIFGNTYVTDAIYFTIDGDDIYFDDLL